MPIIEQYIFEIVNHWLACPENSTSGSTYGGRDVALAAPDGVLNNETCKEFMNKLKYDLPILIKRPFDTIIKSTQTITFSKDDKTRSYSLVFEVKIINT